MNEYPKLIVMLPGVLVRVHSAEEEQKLMRNEIFLLTRVLPAVVALSALAGLFIGWWYQG